MIDSSSRLELSYYKEIGVINETHKIYIVQHIETKKIYVKKILKIFNKAVFLALKNEPATHMPRIHVLYEEKNHLTVIEDYIPGDTLEELLEKGNRFTEEAVIDIILSLCDILSDLHKRVPSIIHRDIKPSNVILTPEKAIYLLDMNAAKFANALEERDTILIGTSGYAAPEQYGFRSSNERTDIFALGILMKTLLNSDFGAVSAISPRLQSIIQKCTQLDPEQRYTSVNQLAENLRNTTRIHQESSKPSTFHKSKIEHPFYPPGFRQFNISHMLIAVLGYLMILVIGTSLTIKESKGQLQLLLNRICLTSIMLMEVALFCNYLNLHELLPLLRNKKGSQKLPGLIIWSLIIMFFMMFILVIIEGIIY